jgi:hypothetical protein
MALTSLPPTTATFQLLRLCSTRPFHTSAFLPFDPVAATLRQPDKPAGETKSTRRIC